MAAEKETGRRVLPLLFVLLLGLVPRVAFGQSNDPDLERPSLGGPVALISVGSALTLLGTLVVGAGAASQGICSSFSSSCSSSGGLLAAGGLMLGTGVVLGAGGGIWLGTLVPKRKAIDEELRARGHIASVRVGLHPALLGPQLGVVGTF